MGTATHLFDEYIPDASDLAEFDDDCDPRHDEITVPLRQPDRRPSDHPDRYLRQVKGGKVQFRTPCVNGVRYNGGLYRTWHDARRARDAFERDREGWVKELTSRRTKHVRPIRHKDGRVEYQATVTLVVSRCPDLQQALRELERFLVTMEGPLFAQLALEAGRETGMKAANGRGRGWAAGTTRSKVTA